MQRKSDVKIEFINFEEDFNKSHSYPMGVLYISAYLKKNGFTNIGYVDHMCLLRKIEESRTLFPKRLEEENLKITEQRRENNLGDLIKHLNNRQPHIILLGPITTPYLVELTDLVERLRQNFSKPLILAGGPHFGKDQMLDGALIKCCSGLDGVVVGEAEETIVAIVDRFYYIWRNEKAQPSRIDFLHEGAKMTNIVIRNKMFMAKKPVRLEDLPSPDMSLLEEYWNNPKIRVDYRYSLSNRRNPFTRTSRALVDDYSGDGNQ
jgi:hypothetical protein